MVIKDIAEFEMNWQKILLGPGKQRKGIKLGKQKEQ
jgi:hypothetical protein